MSRPLRIEAPHLWCHVYNRGNEKRTIVHDDGDRRLFLNHGLFEDFRLYERLVAGSILGSEEFARNLMTVMGRGGGTSRHCRSILSLPSWRKAAV